MRPKDYREDVKCCATCAFARAFSSVQLICCLSDSEEQIGDSKYLEGEELDEWWHRRSVLECGICNSFKEAK